MATATTPWTDADRDALKHAWDWFGVHAVQRMQSFSLLLASVTLGLAGYGVAIQAKNYAVAAVVAAAGVTITIAFGLLDKRNRELVHAAEDALEHLERRLSVVVAVPELEMVIRVERPRMHPVTFTWVVRSIVIAVSVIFLVALAVAMVFAFASFVQASKHGL